MAGIGWLALRNPFARADAFEPGHYFENPKDVAFIRDIQRGNVKRVQAGIAAGRAFAVGLEGYRPIHVALLPKEPQILKLLIAAKADVNAALENGNVPLHFSVRKADPEFTRALLLAEADPNVRGDADTPVLFSALLSRNSAAVELLSYGGVDKATEWNSMSAFYQAVAIEDLEMAALLANLHFALDFDTGTWSVNEELAEKLARWPADDAGNRRRVRALMAALARRDVVLPAAIADRWL